MERNWKGQILGAILRESQLIGPDDIERALDEQRRTGVRFGEALVNLNIVTAEDINWGLSHQMDIPFVRIPADFIDPAAVAAVPGELARRHHLVPYLLVGDELTVVLEDPTNHRAAEELAAVTEMRINVGVGLPEEIDEAIRRIYGDAQPVPPGPDVRSDWFDAGQLAAMNEDATGRVFVDALLSDAVSGKADAIHLDAAGPAVHVRLRHGATLENVAELSRAWAYIVSVRLRRAIREDIPRAGFHEGLLRHEAEAGPRAFHAAFVATAEGESIALTPIRPAPPAPPLAELLGPTQPWRDLRDVLAAPGGMVLVCGERRPERKQLLDLIRGEYPHAEKVVVVGRETWFPQAEIVRVEPKSARPDALLAALEAALRLDADVLLVEDLMDAEAFNVCLAESLAPRRILAATRLPSVTTGLEYVLEKAESRVAVREALRGIVGFHRVPSLVAETSEPDDRRDLAAAALGVDADALAAATPRRPIHPESPGPSRMAISVLPIDTALADAIGEGRRAREVVAMARSRLRLALHEGLGRDVMNGAVALDDYLRVTGGI